MVASGSAAGAAGCAAPALAWRRRTDGLRHRQPGAQPGARRRPRRPGWPPPSRRLSAASNCVYCPGRRRSASSWRGRAAPAPPPAATGSAGRSWSVRARNCSEHRRDRRLQRGRERVLLRGHVEEGDVAAAERGGDRGQDRRAQLAGGVVHRVSRHGAAEAWSRTPPGRRACRNRRRWRGCAARRTPCRAP